MTLPNNYSWSPVGERIYVPFEAPQGRRVNAIGAYFAASGRFVFETRARAPLPKSKKKRAESPIPPLAGGLCVEELGTLDAELFVNFVWESVAGRPPGAGAGWRRDKPLFLVLDNYSVHVSRRVQQERVLWEAADVYLFFLPSYSPELSSIEPVWQWVKHHEMPERSHETLLCAKRAVDSALGLKAQTLSEAARARTVN
jgi:putative transposase